MLDLFYYLSYQESHQHAFKYNQIIFNTTMADDYGSGNDDYGNAVDEDENIEERFSDDSQAEEDYEG